MDLYQKMYVLLFNRVTDALYLLDSGDGEAAMNLLKSAQQQCEEIYLSEE